MSTLYVPSKRRGMPGPAIDPARCRVQTYEAVSRNFGQCSRKKALEVDGIGYCKQHSPEAEAARSAERRAREEADQRRRDRQWKRPEEYRAALLQIAGGHNDPRSLAIEALSKWNDLPEKLQNIGPN